MGVFMLESLSLVFFGWLLGLFGPSIVDAIKKRSLRQEIRFAIESELGEVQYRLTASVYIINLRYGALDKKLLGCVLPIMKKYKGVYATDRLLKSLESNLELNDEQLAALGEIQKSDGSQALTLRKFSTPFLDTHIGNIGLFSCEFQVAVFELKTQIGLLNDQIEDTKSYRAMTFAPDISSENYTAVCHDLEKTYQLIGDRSRTIADAINRISSLSA